jgi:hypothetical protein
MRRRAGRGVVDGGATDEGRGEAPGDSDDEEAKDVGEEGGLSGRGRGVGVHLIEDGWRGGWDGGNRGSGLEV